MGICTIIGIERWAGSMRKPVFRRKVYNEILEWKENSSDKYALLIKGARRVGKSTIAEEFGKNEYKSYVLIDFTKAPAAIINLFDDISDLNWIFMQIQLYYKVELYERESLIIFDEIQFCPKARQAIKHLVADHRYDYLETGSLISIKKNVKNIAQKISEITGYPIQEDIGYPTPGSFGTYCGVERKIPTITLEVSDKLSKDEHFVKQAFDI